MWRSLNLSSSLAHDGASSETDSRNCTFEIWLQSCPLLLKPADAVGYACHSHAYLWMSGNWIIYPREECPLLPAFLVCPQRGSWGSWSSHPAWVDTLLGEAFIASQMPGWLATCPNCSFAPTYLRNCLLKERLRGA